MLDLAICLGRFQPPRRAHLDAIRLGLARADRVAVVLGSSQRPRSPRHPWTSGERQAMISACLAPEELRRIAFIPLPDRLYDEDLWTDSLRRAVQAAAPGASRLALVAPRPDPRVPGWAFLEGPPLEGPEAVEIRRDLFDGGDPCGLDLPAPVQDWLKAWMATAPAAEVIEEHRYLQGYRKAWEAAPYPVNFVTADALVLKAGHVLLVERKHHPGRGLWALPGGFVDTGERVLEAALRELAEETALEVPREELLAALAEREVFDHPFRSQRGRIITHLACFRLGPGPLPAVHPQDDAAQAFWLPVAEVEAHGERFFNDHQDIILHLSRRGG